MVFCRIDTCITVSNFRHFHLKDKYSKHVSLGLCFFEERCLLQKCKTIILVDMDLQATLEE